MPRRPLLALAAAALAAAATPAAVQAAPAVAPGRVILGPATATPERDVDAAGARLAVGTPDGGAILASGRSVLRLTAITRTGALAPGFGSQGLARVTVPTGFTLDQLLRRPDGRLLLVGATRADTTSRLPERVVVGLTPQGAADPAFGAGGVARTGLQVACVSCSPAALQADGSLLVGGSTGTVSPDPKGPADANLRGAVARLTPAGALDPGFGSAGVAPAPGNGIDGVGVAAGGRILLLGRAGTQELVGALTPSGAADPGYAGGGTVPVPVRGFEALFDPTGRVDVAGTTGVTRVGPLGAIDRSFGDAGTAPYPAIPGGFTPQLLPQADGGLLVASRTTYDTGRLASTPALRILRLSPTGQDGGTTAVFLGFGGGLASFAGSTRSTPGIAQDAFAPGTLVQRPTGSLLIPGGVPVIRYTGEGAGSSAAYVAAASLTATLRADTTFGGQQANAELTVTIPSQRARRDVTLHRVLVRVRASGAGLVLLRVRDGRRRVLAQSVEPIYASGTSTIRIPLTATGRRVLRAGPRKVVVGHAFKDLLAARTDGSRVAGLR